MNRLSALDIGADVKLKASAYRELRDFGFLENVPLNATFKVIDATNETYILQYREFAQISVHRSKLKEVSVKKRSALE